MTTKKVIKVSHRGTQSYHAEVGEQNWAGDSYRKVEQDNLKIVPKNTIMHLAHLSFTKTIELGL